MKKVNVIAPNSIVHLIWNLIALITNVFLLIIIPIIGVFGLEMQQDLIIIINILLISDILIKFNVGLFTNDGFIEMKRDKICKNYLNL